MKIAMELGLVCLFEGAVADVYGIVIWVKAEKDDFGGVRDAVISVGNEEEF